MIALAADRTAAVEHLTNRAVDHGARLVKAPFAIDFGPFLSILPNPEGDALRVPHST